MPDVYALFAVVHSEKGHRKLDFTLIRRLDFDWKASAWKDFLIPLRATA
jgi:hypothetical protein